MKIKMRRILAIAIVGAMVCFVSGCGNRTAGNTLGAETNEAVKPSISFMTTAFTGNELKNDYSDKVIQKYEDYTGIRVEWKWEANATYTEKLGLTLMDKANMPMVLQCGTALTGNIVDAAKKGAFWDLKPYIEDEARFPNLSWMNKNVAKAITVDGKLIGVYRTRPIGRMGFSYRTDWAEAVGITKEPKTVDDVYDMLYKFTYGDPDGNGKDDTWGMEMSKYTGPFDVIQTWFGCGNEWVLKDGRMVPVHQTEEYMEALNWLRKVYMDGLIRQDWASVDSTGFGDATKRGETGVFVDVMGGGTRAWDYFTDNDIKSVVDPDKTAAMALVGPVNGATLATSGYNGFFAITKDGAKTEEDVINCLTFLDKMCDDKMLLLADYGLEGISYELNESGQVVINKEMKSENSPNSGLNQAVAYIPNSAATSHKLVSRESTLAQDEAYKRNEAAAVYNPAIGYIANSEMQADVGADIEQIIDDARTQFVCNQIDEEGFARAAQQWLDRGGDRLIEEINELYKADIQSEK